MAATRKPKRGVIAKAKTQLKKQPAKRSTPMAKASSWAKAGGRKSGDADFIKSTRNYLNQGRRSWTADLMKVGQLSANLEKKRKAIEALNREIDNMN